MKTYAPVKVAGSLLGQPVRLSDRCCGEAGTLGTARPDIANQIRFRKQEELTQGIRALTGDGSGDGSGQAPHRLPCLPAGAGQVRR